jgi:pimeloyl-ACP methyl ester carboxylesterase
MNNAKFILLLLMTSLWGLSVSAQAPAVSPFDTTIYGKNTKVGKFVKLRGFNMYYETYGKGEPLLIIHGNGGSINNFLYQIPYFSKNYKVILADSRAQGKSVDAGDSLSYEMMADDLNALLDTMHLDSCYVIGWSDGGINGLLLAIRHPKKVKKLAVTGANLWPDTTAVDPYVYNWAMHYNDTLSKMEQTPQVKNALKLAHLLSYEPHITIEQLHSIQCPTLVIGGDHDVLLPKHTLLIAESIPRSYLWIIPNSGHSTPIHYKDQFNETVGEFFKQPYRVIEREGRFN